MYFKLINWLLFQLLATILQQFCLIYLKTDELRSFLISWSRVSGFRCALPIDDSNSVNLSAGDWDGLLYARMWWWGSRREAECTGEAAGYTRVSHTWCFDMRSPWERRTVVTCGDSVPPWETPGHVSSAARWYARTRSCAPMINRNRQKLKLRVADVARLGNIVDKSSF